MRLRGGLMAWIGAGIVAPIVGGCLVPSYEVGSLGTEGAGGSLSGAGGTPSAGGNQSGGSGGAPSGGAGGSATGGASSGAGGVGGSGMGGAFGGAGGAIAGFGGASGGNGGSGTAGSGGAPGFCPGGAYMLPSVQGNPTRVMGVPPPDSFNTMNTAFGIIEGPVWLDDALYVSEIGSQPYSAAQPAVLKSRLLRITSAGQVSIVLGDTGSNGLALYTNGDLLAAVHGEGSISRIDLASSQITSLLGSYDGSRFNSPNDIAVRSDGTIYFTDPTYQAPNPTPQMQTGLYTVRADLTQVTRETLNQPNGVTLSPDESLLYVSGGQLDRYAVQPDGSLGARATFVEGGGGDGMAVDCAGNLYVAGAPSAPASITIYESTGALWATIPVPEVDATTNVAFGGPDRKTLYITGLGVDEGLFKVQMSVPGLPY